MGVDDIKTPIDDDYLRRQWGQCLTRAPRRTYSRSAEAGLTGKEFSTVKPKG
jgi:hypothetical protein